MAAPRRLCITVDDYGLTEAGNAAIEDLVERRLVSAVSVMTHHGARLDRVRRLSGAPVALGLHLVFTRERPLALAGSPLVDGDGRLPRGWARLFGRLAARPWLAAGLRREAEAQLARFRDLGLALGFVNAHEHAHLFPLVRREVVSLVERLPGAGVRVALGGRLGCSRHGLLALASRVSWRLRPLADRPLLSPLGVEAPRSLDLDAVDALLRRAARAGSSTVAELVVHPSEHALLRARELPRLLDRRGFALVGAGLR